MVFCLLSDPFELGLENEMFVVKGQHVRCRNGYLEDRDIEDTHVLGHIGFNVDQFFLDATIHIGLESWLGDRLSPKFGQVKSTKNNFFISREFR